MALHSTITWIHQHLQKNSIKYHLPVRLENNQTITAIASKEGYINSETTTAYYAEYRQDTIFSLVHDTTFITKNDTTYIIRTDTIYMDDIPATPQIDINNNIVTITCQTIGATIYYSTESF